MLYYTYLPYICAALSAGIGLFALFWGSRSFAYRIFALGMLVFAIEQGLQGMVSQTISPERAIFLSWIKNVFTALLPGVWLLFSLSFARVNYKEVIARWKWVILPTFVLPVILSGVFKNFFYKGISIIDISFGWSLFLGWSGFAFHIVFLACAVLIIVNLENILRVFSGTMYWKLKFMVLGVFFIFAARIYTGSQALLYSSTHLSVESVNAGAGIIAAGLIMVSFFRTRLSEVNIFFSQTFIFHSITIFVVAFYLIAVGILAEIVKYLDVDLAFPLEVFFVFFALIVLSLMLLSDELRLKARFWINRHLKRPNYDYRKVWTDFAQRTLSVIDQREFCTVITKTVADTLGTPAVTIWLLDDKKEFASLGGSTFHSMAKDRSLKLKETAFEEFMNSFQKESIPKIMNRSINGGSNQANDNPSEKFPKTQTWCCVPLKTSQNFIGFLTLSERANGVSFSAEDLDLLKTIADQTARGLFNLRLAEKLREARQLETFQTISTFFVHDLKNLASTLGLTLQNLPLHFDNPEFRQDALEMISNSVDKINHMCGRLSSLNHHLELNRIHTNLNDLTNRILSELNGYTKGILDQDLRDIPETWIDPDQIQKVLTNLIINASEAIGKDGKIQVKTGHRNGWVELTVTDNGCGLPKEFMETSLFQPFKTTKKKGLGIGLFQCKRIMEAHQGKIEVESKKGEGSTFRLFFPVKKSP